MINIFSLYHKRSFSTSWIRLGFVLCKKYHMHSNCVQWADSSSKKHTFLTQNFFSITCFKDYCGCLIAVCIIVNDSLNEIYFHRFDYNFISGIFIRPTDTVFCMIVVFFTWWLFFQTKLYNIFLISFIASCET